LYSEVDYEGNRRRETKRLTRKGQLFSVGRRKKSATRAVRGFVRTRSMKKRFQQLRMNSSGGRLSQRGRESCQRRSDSPYSQIGSSSSPGCSTGRRLSYSPSEPKKSPGVKETTHKGANPFSPKCAVQWTLVESHREGSRRLRGDNGET